MSMIGHNQPPENAFSLSIQEAYELAQNSLTGPIENDEQEAAIAQTVADIKDYARDADAKRKEEAKPHDDAKKAIQARWKPVLGQAETAIDALNSLLTPYRVAKQERLRAEQEDAARKAKEARQAAIDAKRGVPDLMTVGDIIEEADRAAAEAKKAGRATKAPTGLRTYWDGHVADYGAFLKWMKAHRPHELRAMLDDALRREINAGLRVADGAIIEERKRAA